MKNFYILPFLPFTILSQHICAMELEQSKDAMIIKTLITGLELNENQTIPEQLEQCFDEKYTQFNSPQVKGSIDERITLVTEMAILAGLSKKYVPAFSKTAKLKKAYKALGKKNQNIIKENSCGIMVDEMSDSESEKDAHGKVKAAHLLKVANAERERELDTQFDHLKSKNKILDAQITGVIKELEQLKKDQNEQNKKMNDLQKHKHLLTTAQCYLSSQQTSLLEKISEELEEKNKQLQLTQTSIEGWEKDLDATNDVQTRMKIKEQLQEQKRIVEILVPEVNKLRLAKQNIEKRIDANETPLWSDMFPF